MWQSRKRLGEAVAERYPAGQHVAVADGGVGLVTEDHPVAGGGAGDVAGVGVEEAARGAGAIDAGADKARDCPERGMPAGCHHAAGLRAVQVGQYRVDQARPLHDPGVPVHPIPASGSSTGTRSRRQACCAVVGIGIDVECNAAFPQQPPRAFGCSRATVRPQCGEPLDETLPVRTDSAVRGQHLVERCRRSGVAGQQARACSCAGVASLGCGRTRVSSGNGASFTPDAAMRHASPCLLAEPTQVQRVREFRMRVGGLDAHRPRRVALRLEPGQAAAFGLQLVDRQILVVAAAGCITW